MNAAERNLRHFLIIFLNSHNTAAASELNKVSGNFIGVKDAYLIVQQCKVIKLKCHGAKHPKFILPCHLVTHSRAPA